MTRIYDQRLLCLSEWEAVGLLEELQHLENSVREYQELKDAGKTPQYAPHVRRYRVGVIRKVWMEDRCQLPSDGTGGYGEAFVEVVFRYRRSEDGTGFPLFENEYQRSLYESAQRKTRFEEHMDAMWTEDPKTRYLLDKMEIATPVHTLEERIMLGSLVRIKTEIEYETGRHHDHPYTPTHETCDGMDVGGQFFVCGNLLNRKKVRAEVVTVPDEWQEK